MSKEALLWLAAGFGVIMLALSLINWYLAERDERRWRVRMEQIRRDQIIAQHVQRRKRDQIIAQHVQRRKADRDGD